MSINANLWKILFWKTILRHTHKCFSQLFCTGYCVLTHRISIRNIVKCFCKCKHLKLDCLIVYWGIYKLWKSQWIDLFVNFWQSVKATRTNWTSQIRKLSLYALRNELNASILGTLVNWGEYFLKTMKFVVSTVYSVCIFAEIVIIQSVTSNYSWKT